MSSVIDDTSHLEILAEGARPADKAELRLWLRMLSATNLFSAEIRRRLRAEFGVTLPQFDLMAQLAREPDGVRLGVLSRRMMVTNGNVTGLVDRLEKDGLVVRRTTADDRRVTVAALTPKGVASFSGMAAAHEAWVIELMTGVGGAEARQLYRLLGGVKASVIENSGE